jgi:SAM-dependent methyltransferase
MNRRSLLALPVIQLLSLAQASLAQSSDEKIWRDFLDWVKTVPPQQHPGVLVEQYRRKLQADGIGAAAIQHHVDVVLAHMRSGTEGWQQIFNRIYTSPSGGFSTKPNALLVSAVDGRKPGRALDVGMGQGRNSIFLASNGWDVTGFDVSDEGLAVARKNAAAANVKINAVLADRNKFDYGESQWDLVVITYEPSPVTETAYVARLSRALRPGGLLVIESFASDRDAKGRKPVDIDPADLLRAMLGLRILRFEDVEAAPDWGGAVKTRLARLVAQKK